MADIDDRILARELKKGSAELIVLSIVEARARHGYEISKLIELRSGGEIKFHVASRRCTRCSIASRSAAGSRAAGSRSPATGGGASTTSRPKAAACSSTTKRREQKFVRAIASITEVKHA
jgi:hypothetical protein